MAFNRVSNRVVLFETLLLNLEFFSVRKKNCMRKE